MPRLSWHLLRTAWKENPFLFLTVQACRELPTARRELRWLKEQARAKSTRRWKSILFHYCRDRARGKPLQYILGTEFFGELELQCRPGVLIPRQETAAYVTHLAELVNKSAEELPSCLRILDLCTGTGCIPLLFAHLLRNQNLQVLGVDVSEDAINLANLNRLEQSAFYPHSSIKQVQFFQADILRHESHVSQLDLSTRPQHWRASHWDILISNPPYISPQQFKGITHRSVRNYEPKLALVPEPNRYFVSDHEQGDFFYPRLLKIAEDLNVKVLLMEVGDMDQARRVAAYAQTLGRWEGLEIWRDNPSIGCAAEDSFDGIPTKGQGNGRSVLCWKGDGGNWIQRR